MEKDKSNGAEKDNKNNNSNKTECSMLWALLAFFVAMMIMLSIRWAVINFDNLSVRQILNVLTSTLKGTSRYLIINYMIWVPLVAVLLTAQLWVVSEMVKESGRGNEKFRKYTYITSLVIALLSISFFAYKIDFASFIKSSTSDSNYIEMNYVDPSNADIKFPEKKRNLLFIYLESMETSFTDESNGGAVQRNLIPELTALAKENEDFSGDSTRLNGANQMPATSWTMASIFASTTGLPLRMSLDDNSMNYQQTFFPQITAMGDILEEQGYRQVFQIGTDANLGGRKSYLKDHGNFEFRDYPYTKNEGLIPEDYYVFLGHEDTKLYEFSKKTLLELSKSDQPFNMTILTVDTHQPSGHACDLCILKEPYVYFDIIECASHQLSDFIEWVKKQDFYENTTVVIIGDHISMASGLTENLYPDCNRKTYTCIMNSAATVEDKSREREYTIFDIFPTTLASIGAEIEGEKLGLGTNLFSSTDTLTESSGLDYEISELEKKSEFLDSLETYDENTQNAIDIFKDADCVEEISISGQGTDALKLHIKTTDMSEYEDLATVEQIKVKLWFYRNGEYVHNWYDLNNDGSNHWNADLDINYYKDAEPLRYQLLVKTYGAPTVNLGNEGTISLK